jgi:hypothetical protein
MPRSLVAHPGDVHDPKLSSDGDLSGPARLPSCQRLRNIPDAIDQAPRDWGGNAVPEH